MCLGVQKNYLIDTFLLSTHNINIGLEFPTIYVMVEKEQN